MDKINSNHFTKLMTNQPYFVWNSLDDKEFFEDDQLKFNIPSFLDDIEVVETSYSEVQAKSFGIIEVKYKDFIKNEFSEISFLKGKSQEDRIKETQELMKDDHVRYIYSPVFAFEYRGIPVYSSPSVYDKKTSSVYFQKFSPSTKRKDILKFFFDVSVMRICGVEIKNVGLYILATEEYKRGEVNFFLTEYINTNKGGRSDSEARHEYDYYSAQLAKAGMSSNKKGVQNEDQKIIQLIDSPITKNISSWSNIEFYLDKIIDAQSIQETTPVTEKDNSEWAPSPNWKALIEKHHKEFIGVSGNLAGKSQILEGLSINQIANNSETLYDFLTNKEPMINDIKYVENIISRLSQNIIWYDFEAFSLPVSPMDSFLPYEQIVSQVSVIETSNEKEISVKNLVIDPKTVSLESFLEIIDAIYKDGYEYVVYNKSYENSRLKEMVRTLKKFKHPRAQDAYEKVQKIIKHTIDLADLFISSKNKKPIIMIPYLKGLFSIKIIEKYINNHINNFPYKIKEYKKLDIQHGMMAMEAANNRALGITGDLEWEQVTINLKEYCENDVRAMIMVYHLIKMLVK